jgi:ankyrin repeat protein
VIVEHDSGQIGPASKVSDTPPVVDTPSLTAARATFSPTDIILKRLTELKEERHVSPMIFEAAARQDYLTCSRLIQEGVDCDIPGPGGRSLAHVAAMTGNMRLLRTLTSSSKRIWSNCSQGKIPSDYAAFNNHLEVVRYLIEDSSFSLFANDQKLAILERSTEFAQCRGHIRVANYLLERLQDIRRTQNGQLFKDAVSKNDINRVKILLGGGISESSALWVACKSGFIPLVSILLSSTFKGFSYDINSAINFASTTGRQDLLVLLLCGIDNNSERKFEAETAYRCALNAGQVKICEFLVLCGEVNIHYAFQAAADYAHLDLLRWIIEKEGKDKFRGEPINHTFHTAVSSCSSLPLVQFLVKNGADVNSKHAIWGTALRFAAATNNFDLVRYLVSEGGADVNAPGQLGGSSPMMAAVSAGNSSIFHYFHSLRTCSNNQHGIFGNILQTASYLGRREILEEILSSGYDINARLEPYGSALIMAIQGGNFDIAQLLISRGADVNLAIPKYGTALHLAAAGGIENIVKSLIQAGADVNSKGGDFGTPLQAAAANGHQLIVLFLVDCGAEVNTQGGRYGNALQAAQANGHSLLAKFLLFSRAEVTQEVE